MTSLYVQGVSSALTRTTRTLPSQEPSFSAATTFFRASALASTATASSRSRKISSAASPCAFSMKRGLLPGTARVVRRERCMQARLSIRERRDHARFPIAAITRHDVLYERGAGGRGHEEVEPDLARAPR